MATIYECTVKYSLGTYQTNTVRGHRASCSHSEDEAVRHLGVKLFGPQLEYVERMESQPSDATTDIKGRWRIVARAES